MEHVNKLINENCNEMDLIKPKIDFEKLKDKKLIIICLTEFFDNSLNFLDNTNYLRIADEFEIIKYPEAYLHPADQIRRIRQFIRCYGKIILITHSDYMIKELNNLIMLNKHNNKLHELNKSDGFEDYTFDMLIDYKDVSALHFNMKNYAAEELEVTDTGFEVTSIDAVISRLNKVSQQLYFGEDNE